MKKRSLVIVIVTAAALAGVGLWFFWPKEKDGSDLDPGCILTVMKETKAGTVQVSGNIEPREAKKLKFPQQGVIREILVSEGDEVVKGQTLAIQEDDDLVLELDRKSLEIRKRQLAGSSREVSILIREKEKLEKDREHRVLKAPFSGVILKVNQDVGDLYRVEASEDYVIRMVDMSALKARVAVDELDIPQVMEGQDVTFRFDALKDLTFSGYVNKLDRIGRVGETGITVRDIELILPDPDPAIFVPYSFTAEIRVADESDLLLIDETALVYRDDKAFLSPSDDPEDLRSVTVEPYGQGLVKLTSGAEEGETFLQADWAKNQGEMM